MKLRKAEVKSKSFSNSNKFILKDIGKTREIQNMYLGMVHFVV